MPGTVVDVQNTPMKIHQTPFLLEHVFQQVSTNKDKDNINKLYIILEDKTLKEKKKKKKYSRVRGTEKVIPKPSKLQF